MNFYILTGTLPPLRSAASLKDLSWMRAPGLQGSSHKHKIKTGTPADPIGKDHDTLLSTPEFLLSPVPKKGGKPEAVSTSFLLSLPSMF